MKVASYALGCKVNQYESAAVAEAFAARGHEIVDIEDKADLYIIHTCTVTNLGDKKSRQLLRRVKRQNPEALVAATGCYAQNAPEELSALKEVDIIVGTKGRRALVDLAETYTPDMGQVIRVESISQEKDFEPLSIDALSGRTRGYVKVQDGCDRFCTFCIIPFARGPVRSRPGEDVVAEAKRLAKKGFRELVLTGIHVASYGRDLKNMDLLQLLKMVHQVEGIERIRLSSIEPFIATEAFVAGMAALPKMCPHFHLSLQSGSDKILRAMHRRYTAGEYLQAVRRIRKVLPQAEFTTDVIVGFPGEEETDFQDTLDFVREVDFLKVHVFPFSPKKGTPAATSTNQLPNRIKAERSHILGEVSREMTHGRIRAYLGQTLMVLAEEEVSPGVFEGYTPNYIRVRFPAEKAAGRLFPVRLEEISEEVALGKIIFA